MEITRSSASSDVQRCPFCHSNVNDEEEQVACKQCLARHHRACWDEGHRCASCSGSTPLVAAGSTPLAAGEVVAPVAAAPDEDRRAASRILERVGEREESSAAAFLAIPTLGIHTIFAAEKALARHRERNAGELSVPLLVSHDLEQRIDQARKRALSPSGAGLRRVLALGGYIALLATFITAVALDANPYRDTLWRLHEYPAVVPLYVTTWLGFTALLALYLHSFREAVRRHELDQLYVRLVGDAVSPEKTREIADKVQKAWRQRRGEDILVSLFGLALTPVFMLIFVALRARGALALHEEHEELAMNVRGARKEAPPAAERS